MLINVCVEGESLQMDDGLLEKKQGPGWVEYWLRGELVHRSAEVGVSGVSATGAAAKIGPPGGN